MNLKVFAQNSKNLKVQQIFYQEEMNSIDKTKINNVVNALYIVKKRII